MFLTVKKSRLRFIINRYSKIKNKCRVVFLTISKTGRNKRYWRSWKLGKNLSTLYCMYVMTLRNFIILLKFYTIHAALFWNSLIEDIDWIEFLIKINTFVEYL